MAARARLGAVLVLATTVLAACGAFEQSGYQFVRSPSTGTYLKVPDDWTVHGNGDVTSFMDRTGNTPTGFETAVPFITTFGAADDLVAYPFDPLGTTPAGIVQVRLLGRQERDEISFKNMRDELLPIDTGLESGQVEVVSREEVRRGDGARGERLRYIVMEAETLEPIFIDQTTLVDEASSRLYLLAVGCQAACYEQYEDEIDEVVSSLIIKER